MTKKDFEVIARIISNARDSWDPAEEIAIHIASYCTATYWPFDLNRFMLATQLREFTESDCAV